MTVGAPAGKVEGKEKEDKQEEEQKEVQEDTTRRKVENNKTQITDMNTLNGSGKDLEQPIALMLPSQQKRAEIHTDPSSSWFLALCLGLSLTCILAVVGLGCHLHRPRDRRPASSSPFSDLSPTFHSAKLAFSATPPEERVTEAGGAASASRAHKFQAWEGARAGPQRNESLVDLDVEGDCEEEGDLVYECPGLAPHGEMVVTNPFFLSEELCSPPGKASSPPCPVNVNNNMRHGSINRNIQ